MIIRSFANGFEVADWTQELNVVPNVWGTVGNLGIFTPEPVAEHVVAFEETIAEGGLLIDRVRGERGTVGKDRTRKIHTFAVPHFPHDDYITPQDLQGKRAYGSASDEETLAAVRMRKMEDVRRKHAQTLEYARCLAITAGTVYAPSNTVVQNWNTEFGVTRLSVDCTFGTSTTDLGAQIEKGIAQAQDNALGENMNGTVILCSPEFFSKFVGHSSTRTAFQFYSSTQEPLRARLGGNNAMNRRFDFAGTTLIEMRDTTAGQRHIPANEAFMVPTGTQAFKTYFSPANRFGLTNTLGEEAYLFETSDPKMTKIELESESNFANALLRPAMITRFFSSN